MAKAASSYIRTNGSALTRAADALSWANVMGRIQSMTVYFRAVELGQLLFPSDTIVWQISDGSTNKPYFRLIAKSTGVYEAQMAGTTAGTPAAATLGAAPTFGQLFEIRVVLAVTGQSGILTIGQSIAGASETTVSAAAVTVGQAWSGPTLFLHSVGGVAQGLMGLRNLDAIRGVHTLATMRRLAGV